MSPPANAFPHATTAPLSVTAAKAFWLAATMKEPSLKAASDALSILPPYELAPQANTSRFSLRAANAYLLGMIASTWLKSKSPEFPPYPEEPQHITSPT